MNITEANAVNDLLDWVTSLTLWEGGSVVSDGELLDAVGYLAERAHRALHGAGITRQMAEDGMRVVLGPPEDDQ